MNLTETGESRVNGYLFVLERSLKTFLPPEVVRDGAPNERDALEKILAELGPPLRVAQAYSAERTIDEAVTTGRFVPMLRAVGHLALTTFAGFFVALGLLTAYLGSVGFVALAFLKPIFPNNVGIWVHDATPSEWSFNFGASFPGLPHQHVIGRGDPKRRHRAGPPAARRRQPDRNVPRRTRLSRQMVETAAA